MSGHLEVSQRAREAAATLARKEQLGANWAGTIEAGHADSDAMVQAFARFERDILTNRTASVPVRSERERALLEALHNADCLRTSLHGGLREVVLVYQHSKTGMAAFEVLSDAIAQVPA